MSRPVNIHSFKELLICNIYGMHYIIHVVLQLVIFQQHNLFFENPLTGLVFVFVSLFTPRHVLDICAVLSSPLTCDSCVCVFVSVLMEQYPTEEDMIEWAKRESEREEKERLARLTQQEQEDLELAIALSKSELS